MKTHLTSALFLLFFAGCGGGDPSIHVDGTRPLTGLTQAERQEVCSAVISRFGGEGSEHSCNGGKDKITIHSVDECASGIASAPKSCAATVADIDDCTSAQAKDLCTPIESKSCDKVAACQGS